MTREIVLDGKKFTTALRHDGRRRVRLVDTVGFIRKLPHHLVASFRATLEEVRRADLLLHVIDASHRDWEEQVTVVSEVLEELGAGGTSVLHVFNKMDLVADAATFRDDTRRSFDNAVFVSAASGQVDELRSALAVRSCSTGP